MRTSNFFFFASAAMILTAHVGQARPLTHALNPDISKRDLDFGKARLLSPQALLDDYENSLKDSLKRLYRLRASIDGLANGDTNPDPDLDALAQQADKEGRKEGSRPLPNPRLQFAIFTELMRQESMFKDLRDFKKEFADKKEISKDKIKGIAINRADLDFIGVAIQTAETENIAYRKMINDPKLQKLVTQITEERQKVKPDQKLIGKLYDQVTELRHQMEHKVSRDVLAHYTKEVKAKWAINSSPFVRDNLGDFAGEFDDLIKILGPMNENSLPSDARVEKQRVEAAIAYTQARMPLGILTVNRNLLHAFAINFLKLQDEKWNPLRSSFLQLVGNDNGQPRDPEVYNMLFPKH